MLKSIYQRPSGARITTYKARRDFDAVEIEKPAPAITVDASTECHVTPADVAARMVDYLDCATGDTVLEPSAGTGQLMRAITASGADVVAVEKHYKLAEYCGATQSDFLEWETDQRFKYICMNPPFSKVKQHIKKAVDLLAEGGRTVALVPITFSGGYEVERLPVDTFATCKVYTKIIIIEG